MITHAHHFTPEGFKREVLEAGVPAVVDFYADWCGPCRIVGPVVDTLARELAGSVTVGKVNVDDQPDLARRFSVNSIPTIILFRDGKEVDRIIGAATLTTLRNRLKLARAA